MLKKKEKVYARESINRFSVWAAFAWNFRPERRRNCAFFIRNRRRLRRQRWCHTLEDRPSQARAKQKDRHAATQQRRHGAKPGAAGFKPLKLLRRLQSAPHSVTYGAIWPLSRSLWAANLKQQMVPNKRFMTILLLGLSASGNKTSEKSRLRRRRRYEM